MKINDIENMQKYIANIKAISDRLDYNTSSAINKEIVKINPILQNEYDRMSEEKITINCPKLMMVRNNEILSKYMVNSIVTALNMQLSELIANGYKVVDYNLYLSDNKIDDNTYFIIKYTS